MYTPSRAARRPHLLVLVGIPGSGKSTYARRLRARCPGLRIVCPDDIRERLHPGYADGRVDARAIDDRRIFRMAYAEVEDALARGDDVVFDATSLTPARRHRLIVMGRRHGAVLWARYFPIGVPDAMARNAHRARRVPAGVIARMARIIVPPTRAEGFTRIVRRGDA